MDRFTDLQLELQLTTRSVNTLLEGIWTVASLVKKVKFLYSKNYLYL